MGYNFLDDSLLSQLWDKMLNTFALRSGTEGANVLWTNPSTDDPKIFPTDGSSASTTITLSESINNYKYIIIEYQQWNSYPTIETKIVENKNFGTTTAGNTTFTILSFISSYNSSNYPTYYYSRYLASISGHPEQLIIYTCKGFGSNSFTTQDTTSTYSCLVPLRILGCNRVNFDTSITEVISNKVTSINQFSTDTQYPSALAVYNAINNKLFLCPNFKITHGGGTTMMQDLNISATIPILTNNSTLPNTSSATFEKRSLGGFLSLYITNRSSDSIGIITTTREIPVSGTYKENVGTTSQVTYQIVKLRATTQAISYTWTLIDSNGNSHSMPTGCTYTGELNTVI